MKFTVNWLKQHLETDASIDEISSMLTMVGLEVEKITNRAHGLESFVIGHVVEATPHPNADRLRVCKVDAGSGVVDLVCGAPNARTGLTGVFAPSGSYIPGTDLTLKPTEIRGVVSNGMLLSEREMGLSDEHDGIIELGGAPAPGTKAVDVMGLSDTIIEIAITPNRGDCLGVRGIARDLAAAGLGKLKPLDTTPVTGAYDSSTKVHLEFDHDDTSPCPFFVGRHIRGVKNVESPKWLKDRLVSIGLRPISALVDITNYMTFDLNRPLHVFDSKMVKGDLHVRLAKSGEKIMALNDKEYTLDDTMCVITDDENVESLGGVMGGLATGCVDETTEVFVEAACFDPIRTAITGRKLNVLSDARFRFERGIDTAFIKDGMEIATRLILDICGGEPSHIVTTGTQPEHAQVITLRPQRILQLAGVDVPTDDIKRILAALGFITDAAGSDLVVIVPTWRNDIVGEACLVEEVVRIFGYDKIPITSLTIDPGMAKITATADQQRRARARHSLANLGMVEAVTYSFLNNKTATLFGGGSAALHLINPISSDLDVMRPSILPGLIEAQGRNAARGMANLALFEIGPVFRGPLPDQQSIHAVGIRAGLTGQKHWNNQPRKVDVFDAKADVLTVLNELGIAADRAQVVTGAPEWYHPGRSGVLQLGPKNRLACFGEIHPRILKAMDVKGPIVAFEIYLSDLAQPKKRKSATRPHLDLPELHTVERDFAFVVDADVGAVKVVSAAKNADKKLITDVQVFDQFVGGNLGEGKKSLGITVTLQPWDKTLTDAEIEDISDKVIFEVKKTSGGVLRS